MCIQNIKPYLVYTTFFKYCKDKRLTILNISYVLNLIAFKNFLFGPLKLMEFIPYDSFDEIQQQISEEIKVSRLLSASKFLQYIGSAKIASSLNTEEELEPSRQWINITAEKIGLVLEIPSDMQEERYAASKYAEERTEEEDAEYLRKRAP